MRLILRILRDQIWQFIGALLGLFALALSAYLFLLSQQVKALQVTVLANTPLKEIENMTPEELADKQLINVNRSLITAKLEHVGNQSIREEDYARPISFLFPEQSTVIRANLNESVPDNIGITVTWEKNRVTLSKSLLNAGDRVIIEILVANMPQDRQPLPFQVDARFAEAKPITVVSSIKERQAPAILYNPVWLWLGVSTGFIAVIFTIISFRRNIKKLQVTVLVNRSLAEFDSSGVRDVKVLYKDEHISNLYEVLVELENTGRRSILESDYDQPVTFVFQKQTKICEAQILESSPHNIGISLNASDGNTVSLSPVLLNPKDKVRIKFFIGDVPPDSSEVPVAVMARIVGLKSVHIKDK